MSGDTENPRIWLNGDVRVADVGSTAPTDTDTAWAGAWEALGLLSDDGMIESRNNSTQDHYAWGGILIRTTRNQHMRTFRVTALEDTPVVRDLVDPGMTAAESDGVTTRTVKVPTSNRKAFGIETTDGEITRRIVIPRGEVIEVADVNAQDDDMQMFEMTIHVYPDSDGVLYYEITDDPQADPSGS
jgi:hypothetical protein